ncbi:glycerol-3-phosphate dehydrogenase [Thalassovita taeanensis]|uniref:Glycerol-3-phosphate dehydrogenase n=1 Tax=Thalassovita taeanensis TaxID=657014 RepID=A0A1H9ELK0_9RHOB|nr:glycerol-3-phosphate dehydrogenase [Thalassovita taeanensis]SEQ26457.1 homodimeric glycerol 3-phosphate dehydrogenase (quinone) [Thalassovita taeanensis]
MPDTPFYDLFVIGGGINGCGIARDAAGRGMSVCLAEMGDLAGATSSASTKLFHGGLRYLEYFELRLVREALIEREVLLRAMPHISWPMRFVLPLHRDMRFEAETPASRVLSVFMPWMRGRRPAWMIRAGLFLYDHLGGRKILPATRALNLRSDPAGAALQEKYARAFEYSDCWVQDSRLVVLNARDAAAKGATILTRTRVTGTERDADGWRITVEVGGQTQVIRARALVNAAGPWVQQVLGQVAHVNSPASVRLVRGSHIVTRRLFDHDKCYFFQGTDGRIIFAIPYEQEFTLIGTTDADHTDPNTPPAITEAETDYLLNFANGYFKQRLSRDDIVWTYSGVRPLYDDGAGSAQSATRDYVLKLDDHGAPLLSVFGGKITTYRRLAEHALQKLAPLVSGMGEAWTAGAALPGGDFPVAEVQDRIAALQADFPFLTAAWALRLFRAYGTETWEVLGDANSAADLGQDFGATLTEAELRWMVAREYARTAQDALWRRSKLGLGLDPAQVRAVEDWMRAQA